MKKKVPMYLKFLVVVIALLILLVIFSFNREIPFLSPLVKQIAKQAAMPAEPPCLFCTSDLSCNSNQLCVDGCCRSATCTDTDEGINPQESGQVRLSIEGKQITSLINDACVDEDTLNEQYCIESASASIELNCFAETCNEGKCTTCTDTDGGTDVFLLGTVTETTMDEEMTDFCWNPTTGLECEGPAEEGCFIVEHSCKNIWDKEYGNALKEILSCPENSVCQNGMCNIPPEEDYPCSFPSTNQDWIIESGQLCENQVINMWQDKNISVLSGGTLILRNVTLIMHGTGYDKSEINVSTGGKLYIDRSSITSSNSDFEYGFNVRGYLDLRNSFVSELSQNGIYLFGADNSIVFNNTIISDIGKGIFVLTTPNVFISNNMILTSAHSGYGVYSIGSPHLMIRNNKITTMGQGGFGLYYNHYNITVDRNEITTYGPGGIGIVAGSNTKIINNRIKTFATLSPSVGHGATFGSSVNFTNNTIETYGIASEGLYAYGDNNEIFLNTITTFNDSSRAVMVIGDENRLTNNNISAKGGYAYGKNVMAVYISAGTKTIVSENIITTTNSNAFGIFIAAPSNVIKENEINSKGTSIYLRYDSSNTSLIGNQINSEEGYGIELYGENISVKNNTIRTFSTAFRVGANYPIVEGNDIETTGFILAHGIEFVEPFNGGVFKENKIATQGDDCAGIIAFGDSHSFSKNEITTSGYDSDALRLSVANSQIKQNVLQTPLGYPVRMTIYGGMNGDNNVFRDSTFEEYNGEMSEVYIETRAGSSSMNNQVINCSYNEAVLNEDYYSNGGPIELARKWYLDINVVDKNNQPLAGAVIESFDNRGILEKVTSTDSYGKSRQELTDYKQDAEGTIYYTPHTIRISLAGYAPQVFTVDMAENIYLDVQLTSTK